mmetsp:Transcript_5272/g.12156  ORF Transcript_5272/g.12156 Transcript_5272/m.12156 type:complete len:253 (-) Transcript_5272:351-1109(-)
MRMMLPPLQYHLGQKRILGKENCNSVLKPHNQLTHQLPGHPHQIFGLQPKSSNCTKLTCFNWASMLARATDSNLASGISSKSSKPSRSKLLPTTGTSQMCPPATGCPCKERECLSKLSWNLQLSSCPHARSTIPASRMPPLCLSRVSLALPKCPSKFKSPMVETVASSLEAARGPPGKCFCPAAASWVRCSGCPSSPLSLCHRVQLSCIHLEGELPHFVLNSKLLCNDLKLHHKVQPGRYNSFLNSVRASCS